VNSPARRTPDHLRVDPDRLPDPRALAAARSGFSGPVRRIVLFAVSAVVALSLGAFTLRGVLQRVRAGAAAPEILARLPALAVEGVPGGDAPAKRAERVATPEERAELEKSWIGSETIAPRDGARDGATGEEVAPFQGFAVDVETSPSGARVLVDGADVGASPILATVKCAAGATVDVRAERGSARGRAVTRCRGDAVVKVKIALHPR
jgi:PEGA domain